MGKILQFPNGERGDHAKPLTRTEKIAVVGIVVLLGGWCTLLVWLIVKFTL